jgi:hypothetical protein
VGQRPTAGEMGFYVHGKGLCGKPTGFLGVRVIQFAFTSYDKSKR